MFGGVSLNMSARSNNAPSSLFSNRPDLSVTPEPFNFIDILSPLTLGWLSSTNKDAHLLGQHTVRMSPISTAQLNHHAQSFCLAPPDNFVLIPVLLNNTDLSVLRYSLAPLGSDRKESVEYVDVTAKEFKIIEQSRLETLRHSRPPPSVPGHSEEYDEYDDDTDDSERQLAHSSLQKSQSLVYIRLTKPGTLRLERVFDVTNVDARLQYPSAVTIVPCPRVEFVEDDITKDNVRCAGQDSELGLMIDIHGVPPLSLRWLKMINGKREQFLVEGIEGGPEREPTPSSAHGVDPENSVGRDGALTRRTMVPQNLQIPLTIPLDVSGTYLYALEEVMDAVGNVVRLGSDLAIADSGSTSQTKITRSLMVLRRPTVSFKNCGPGIPTSLLIGSDVSLSISANEADTFDAPWDISLKYKPPTDADGNKGSKRFKPWMKTFKTQGDNQELSVRANAPGDYMIIGVHGKRCSGDVLAPETCKVVEKPLPTAEIEWKRIHECSGDTGVSATLVMHGTPPFQVYYRVQRDNEPPRESSKPFASSRGELTLQPERSGHYIFTFVQMSDTYYKKVQLNGPSIEQVVHPLAAADFVTGHTGNKRTMSSCEGGIVGVDVDLRGTGPWNLEVQVVGPRSSENIEIQGIDTPQKTLEIPVPKSVDTNGGTFEINIVSVEDAYKCKRPISVPGIFVNVRRIKPTARFYGSETKRHTTVLEEGTASLPLRLTGDGPWHITYRLVGDGNKTHTKTLVSPNDYLHVTQKGVYEIIDIADSQCSGSVVTDGATYKVDWIPRPVAKLSPQTKAVFESYNGSNILPSVCEGTNDHVDLDLMGRPPFQIMYNIALNGGTGGMNLLDQPTFNSIQPRTRFQLQTSHPGRVYYEVKQIGDAAYPLSKHKNAVIPRSERLLFEQQISMRPTARFSNRNRVSYCLNDTFVPLDLLSADGTVIFDGTPPFTLKLTIKNLAASHIDEIIVDVPDSNWKIDLPSYNFKSIGPHLVTIESVRDASNCAPAASDPLFSSIWVDVAETAAIIPFDRREHFCVGEVSQFQLEGIPPWNIGYRINGKSYTQEAKVSPFSLLQKQAGEFTITSIAHQQKLCKAAVTDLRFSVHPLPSAQVGHGKRIHQDIHEGDQAEIMFTLLGEPPFTFTYQRSEPIPKKGGKPGRVLESHTVSRVYSNEYTIYSALEGTWTVTSISDGYCRYPTGHPDPSLDDHRR